MTTVCKRTENLYEDTDIVVCAELVRFHADIHGHMGDDHRINQIHNTAKLVVLGNYRSKSLEDEGLRNKGLLMGDLCPKNEKPHLLDLYGRFVKFYGKFVKLSESYALQCLDV